MKKFGERKELENVRETHGDAKTTAPRVVGKEIFEKGEFSSLPGAWIHLVHQIYQFILFLKNKIINISYL